MFTPNNTDSLNPPRLKLIKKVITSHQILEEKAFIDLL